MPSLRISRSRALISSNLGRPRRRCATRALNLSGSQTIFSPPLSRLPPSSRPRSLPAPSLSGPVTSGEGRLQVHFAQWGESVGGTKSHPTRARGSDQETALAEPRRLHPKRQHRRNPLFPSHAIDKVSNRGAWACFLRRASGFVGFEKWSANIVDNIRPIPFKPKFQKVI